MKRREYIGTAIAALATGTLAGCSSGGGDSATPGGTAGTTTTGGTGTTTTTASVTFERQTTGGETVTVQSVTLPSDGYVAIYDVQKGQNAPTGAIIGVSAYLEPGTHENVPVGLFDVPGGNFSLGQLQKSQTLSAVPHQETTGNRTFDFLLQNSAGDIPYTDTPSGSAIIDTAYITVKNTSPTGTATTTAGRTTRTRTETQAERSRRPMR